MTIVVGTFPGRNPGHPRLFRVSLGNASNLGVDDLARDLDRDGLLGFGDVGEFGFHQREMRKGGLEPPYPFGYQILSLARLPVPPLSRIGQRSMKLPMLCCDRDRSLKNPVEHRRAYAVCLLARGWARSIRGRTVLRSFRYVGDDQLIDGAACGRAGVDRPPGGDTSNRELGIHGGGVAVLLDDRRGARIRHHHQRSTSTGRHDGLLQASLIEHRETLRRVAGEIGGSAQRLIRGIAIHEVSAAGFIDRFEEGSVLERDVSALKASATALRWAGSQMRGSDVPSSRHVETTLTVEAKQPVESGPVQEDQHCREFGCVCVRYAAIASKLGSRRVEAPVAHVVVTGVAAAAMLPLQRFKARP